MVLLSRHNRSRFRVYILFSLIILSVYYFWPHKSIAEIASKTSGVSQKNSYTDNSRKDNINNVDIGGNPDNTQNGANTQETDSSIYDIGKDPLRVDFNPDRNDVVIPHVIKLEKVNEALNSLHLQPLLSDDSSLSSSHLDVPPPEERISLLSSFIKDASYTKYGLKGFIGNIELPKSMESYKELPCSQMTYKPTTDRELEISEPILIEDDLKEIKEFLETTKYAPLLTMGAKVGEKISDSWFKFSGSSVWLPNYQCHLMVSRIIYAPESRNKPVASFLRLQVFDENWQEIRGKRFRYNDITKQEVDEVLRDFSDSKDENLLDNISVKFPYILDIPFDPKVKVKQLLGPEDPRIIVKDGEYSSEPIIIFNMLDDNSKRAMYSVFPFRKMNAKTKKLDILQFKIQGLKASTQTSMEKNWAPFFDSFKIGDSSKSKGYIHFLYTVDPLVILKCSLDNGRCEKLQDNIYYSKLTESGQYLRGGSNLTPVPREVIQLVTKGESSKRLQMWVGLFKTHLKNCGCGSDTYRPVLAVLIKEDGIFRVEYLSQPIDFNRPVLSWDTQSDLCQGTNILSPNGISFWEIESPETTASDSDQLPKFNDFMGITVSEADFNTKLYFVKNVLNYIFGIYNNNANSLSTESKKFMLDGGYEDDQLVPRTVQVSQCMLESGLDYCHDYSLKHSISPKSAKKNFD